MAKPQHRKQSSIARRACVLLGACSLVTLWSNPAAAYRTARDLPKFAETDRVAWAEPIIRYQIQEDLPTGFTLFQFEQTVRETFGAWSALECGGPVFSYSGSTYVHAAANDSQNTIEWVESGWTERGFDPQAAAVSDVQYAKSEGGPWQIVEADLYINGESFKWGLAGDNGPGTRDLHSVLTHEAGHLLGLLHPCEAGGANGAPDCASNPSFAETTMYPLYDPTQSVLSDDDEAGACFLYPTPACEHTGCPEGFVCTPGGCKEPCGDTQCAANEVCVDGQCVSPTTPDCVSDQACPVTSRCVEGHCVPARAPGDPCTEAVECLSNSCTEDGACARSCASKSECLAEQTCQHEPSQKGICEGPGSGLGTACSDSQDCLGGECLSGAYDAPVCTRRCGKDLPECPGGWVCGTIANRQVCRPTNLPDGGECTTSPSTPRSSGVLWGSLLLFQLAFVIRRLRRRSAVCTNSMSPRSKSESIRVRRKEP